MKIGLSLDGLLCDTESLKTEWLRRLGDDSFIRDAGFWAALKPYTDAGPSVKLLSVNHQVYVFAERPKSMFMPTRAWMKNNVGLVLNKDRLIMPAIPRYDCRLLGISHYIDSDPAVIENLKIETVAPITTYYVDRQQGGSLLQTVEEICESLRS